MAEPNGLIESLEQYTETNEKGEKVETPVTLQRYWTTEMSATDKDREDFDKTGNDLVRRFLDSKATVSTPQSGQTRVNLFTSNVQTLRALMYGRTPAVDVRRRFLDPNDDVARVAGEILERLLNMDIERDSDTFAEAMEHALDDRLIPGLGVAKLRYEADFEEQDEVPAITGNCPLCQGEKKIQMASGPQDCPDCQGQGQIEQAPAYTPEPQKTREDVVTDYFYWEDVRWSPCRTWASCRWIAFKTPMTKDQIKKEWGDEFDDVPFNSKDKSTKDQFDPESVNPWQRVDVWEIWSKERKKVYYWVKGYSKIIEEKDDPLGLEGFWPCAQPLMANLTTTRMMPRADFVLAQDLYDEVDSVSSRITLLEQAIAARGVYDKTSEEIKRLLSETAGNELIGIDDFELFKGAGGLEGVIDWLPVEVFANCLTVLRDYRKELINLLYQVTGFSDIMRGEAAGGQAVTATEQALKAKFASTRVKHFQDQFAKFCSDTQMIKAEIIAKLFDPATIFDRANVKYMLGADPQVAQQAIQMLKQDVYQYRVEIKPETIAAEDLAAVKQERSTFLLAVAQFLQSAGPIGAQAPWAVPGLLSMLQWSMAAYKDAGSIEGVLDQMVQSANQMAQQHAQQGPQPDPKAEAAKVKAQAEIQKSQLDLQHTRVQHQAKMEQVRVDMVKAKQQHDLDLRKMQMEIQKTAVQAALQPQGGSDAGNGAR